MPDQMLPLEAIARTAGILVERPRSLVVHVATSGQLSPTGRMRKGTRPVCNQPGRPCRQARFDGRPLCRRCTRIVAVTTSATTSGVHRLELTAPRLRVTITATRSADELAAAVRLLSLAAGGMTLRMAELVRDQRRALGLDTTRPIQLPPQRSRPGKRAAWWELGS